MTGLVSIVLVLTLSAGGRAPKVAPDFEARFLYKIATTFGDLPLSDVGLSYDSAHHELYVTGDGPVRVFNESGMEVYSFRDSPEIGIVRGIASIEDGTLLAFAYRGTQLALVRCNFRGEYLGEIAPRHVPEKLAELRPSLMRYRDGKIYLVDQGAMRVLVLDQTGEYVASYDVAEKLGEGPRREQLGIRGFSVDGEGNLLFTIQPLFSAYTMTPDGEMRAFGQRGSAPGKFNVVGGITRDDGGYYYVVDILKSAVIVFDPEFQFVKEFGYRTRRPGGLAAPEDILAANGKLYVSNRGRNGVAVFAVGLNAPAPVPAPDPAAATSAATSADRR